MASAGVSASAERSLKDASLKEHLQQLRQTDNVTNWYYVLRTYLYLALVLGATLTFYSAQDAQGWSFWWNVPVTFLAITLIGAGQHQLSGLGHEGSHHTLFRHRRLNELASDWLCMFPLFSSTHQYRLQHHAHHQFVNDPERDPDVSQLKTSGHWLAFPLSKRTALITLLKQLWPPRLLRFILVRASYNSMGNDRNPYVLKGAPAWRGPKVLALVYLLGQIGLLVGLRQHGDLLLLALVPGLLWVLMVGYYLLLPREAFAESRIHPVISMRWTTISRLTYLTIVFNVFNWLSVWTGAPTGVYFALLWVAPLLTSFAFFMILRQIVQHGNGDRGWLTNTRVFFVHRFINFAVFPIGQDFHLPHHLYASVPHYRLRRLHEILLNYSEYREQAVVVEGYFLPQREPPRPPTVLEVLGPEFAPREFRGIHIDNSVLEDEIVVDKESLLREGRAEVAPPAPTTQT